MYALTMFAAKAADAAAEGTAGGGGFIMIIYIVIILAAMYFIMIRPQKKKQKEEQKLRDSITVGDEIITIGGLYGRVVSVKEDSYVIESVADANHAKIKIAKWAAQTNLTVHEEEAAVKTAEKKKKLFGKNTEN